jgi:protein-tyrosine phosphatase
VGTLVVLVLIIGPVIFAEREVAHRRNFRVVEDGILYRSGRMTEDALKRVINDFGIRTVISLRDGTTAPDQAEEAFCNNQELNFVRIPPSVWGDLGGEPPAEEGVRKFREVMSDRRNYPVLLHCLAGIHRTGIFTAIYRMEFDHWSNDQAMQEMRSCGYVELDEHLDVLGYLQQYRPHWKQPEGTAPHAPQPVLQPPAVRGRVASLHHTAAIKPAPSSQPRPKRRKQFPGERKSRSRTAPPGATDEDVVPAAPPLAEE